jgi:hypothetical protein
VDSKGDFRNSGASEEELNRVVSVDGCRSDSISPQLCCAPSLQPSPRFDRQKKIDLVI